MNQSKLMVQLEKERRAETKSKYDEQRIDQIFGTISKIEPKNLMLIQFLILIIEKGFIRNSHSIGMFADLYQEVRGKNTLEDMESASNNPKGNEGEENKFHKKKFISLLKEIGKKIYPGQASAFENIIYEKIAGVEHQDSRIKIDDTVRKMLTVETIKTLSENQRFFQAIFQVYMPENYNSRMGFTWQQIKVLEKKLPIVCLLRFLHEAEVIPQMISPNLFFQNCSKMVPPLNTNHKEVMFYYSETITNYMRDYVCLPHIRIIQGDIGLNFFEFQIMFAKLAADFSKDPKQQFSNSIEKLLSYIKIKEVVQDPKQGLSKDTKFLHSVKHYLLSDKKAVSKAVSKKRQSKQKIEQLFDFHDEQFDCELKRNQFDSVKLSASQIELIRKVLEDQLPPIPEKESVQKQNQGFYDMNAKHMVIGQQLPKIQDKNKGNQSKNNKKQKEDQLLGYKPEIEDKKIISNDLFQNLVKRSKKLRVNNQFPIILSEIIYPSEVPSLVFSPPSEIYLETTYIHLGERLYEKAFVNFRKAKSLIDTKSVQSEIFFQLLEAQIFQSAGKDEAALSFYNKAKQISFNLPPGETYLRSIAYLGLGACLYHLEQYEFAFRCFLKAQSIRDKSIQMESVENAIIQNNIGCCLMMLNRNNEAMRKFQISERIFDFKVGKFDQRTLVAGQNYNKNKKAYIQMMPPFKTMWRTYVEKVNTKALPKGKVKPKK